VFKLLILRCRDCQISHGSRRALPKIAQNDSERLPPDRFRESQTKERSGAQCAAAGAERKNAREVVGTCTYVPVALGISVAR
jgi:hypothetical protein